MPIAEAPPGIVFARVTISRGGQPKTKESLEEFWRQNSKQRCDLSAKQEPCLTRFLSGFCAVFAIDGAEGRG